MRQVSRPITVKICTPLPVPVNEMTDLQKLAERVAEAAHLEPSGFIGMRQEDTDLVIYFETEIP